MSQPMASSTRGLVSTRAVRGKGVGRQARRRTTQPADTPSESHLAASSSSSNPSMQRKPPLTHFISLPIGHHTSLQERISGFTTALRNNDPPIPGLDDSIIIPPRRLHLTLGVMSLSADSAALPQPRHGSWTMRHEAQPQTHPLSSALALLMALKPRIMSILGTHKLRIALDSMDVMKPDRGDLDRAHVLWLGPLLEGEDAMRLKEICALVNKAFLDAGLLVDERRPLKLHCTVINTIHRKPRSKTRRGQPFSYAAVLASTAFQAIAQPLPKGMSKPTAATAVTSTGRSVFVDFGVWDVDEIQICEMGSWGAEGEYVSCGGCSLVDNV